MAQAQKTPIDLYYWPTPNGWKVTIMLEECGLPYDIKLINIGKGDQFEPSFLKISPNNRIPAIVDHDGPGGQPISVFESGAILQYLGRKTGKFYPADERKCVAVEEWLFWQVGGLGPMSGQANHFRNYAPEKVEHGINRYTNEVNRLYGVMNRQLADHEYLAGDYSIADMASIGWMKSAERSEIDIGSCEWRTAQNGRNVGGPLAAAWLLPLRQSRLGQIDQGDHGEADETDAPGSVHGRFSEGEARKRPATPSEEGGGARGPVGARGPKGAGVTAPSGNRNEEERWGGPRRGRRPIPLS